MSFSPDSLVPLLEGERGGAWCVAFSGGLDSTVLLHALSALSGRMGARLRALHVDHGLHQESRSWAARCVASCDALGIECRVLDVKVRHDHPEGPEAAAREARYTVLAGELAVGEVLMTAQHLDDQAETVLLAVLRGSGPDGVAAMPAVTHFGAGLLMRPLLGTTRAQLRTWAVSQGVSWAEDPANTDDRFLRSWLRRAVMPVITARSPGFVRSLARSAALAAEASTLLDTLSAIDIGVGGDAPLPMALLSVHGPERGRNLIRGWLRRQSLPLPPFPRLVEAHRQLLEAAPDRNPVIQWPGCVLRRYQGAVHAHVPMVDIPAGWSATWPGQGSLALPVGLGELKLVPATSGLSVARLADHDIEVRFRSGGERLQAEGDAHHSAVKQLLQRAGVPPWERGRIPMLFVGEELVAVGSLWCAAAWASEDGAPALEVVIEGTGR